MLPTLLSAKRSVNLLTLCTAYHISLAPCDCSFSRVWKSYILFQVHIVTQTKFINDKITAAWLQKGATEVREFFVPSNYKTPNGTMYKARNIYYWQDMGGVGTDCDETRSWILSLDEEAVILRSLVTSFIKEVLNNIDEPKIGFAVSPALIDVKTGHISFWTKLMEARFIAWHHAFLRSRMNGVHGANFFHGGAFFARASVERSLGNDWGPMPSVAEDFATGLAATKQNVSSRWKIPRVP